MAQAIGYQGKATAYHGTAARYQGFKIKSRMAKRTAKGKAKRKAGVLKKLKGDGPVSRYMTKAEDDLALNMYHKQKQLKALCHRGVVWPRQIHDYKGDLQEEKVRGERRWPPKSSDERRRDAHHKDYTEDGGKCSKSTRTQKRSTESCARRLWGRGFRWLLEAPWCANVSVTVADSCRHSRRSLNSI